MGAAGNLAEGYGPAKKTKKKNCYRQLRLSKLVKLNREEPTYYLPTRSFLRKPETDIESMRLASELAKEGTRGCEEGCDRREQPTNQPPEQKPFLDRPGSAPAPTAGGGRGGT